MVEDVGPGSDDFFDGGKSPVEIRGKDLDDAIGVLVTDGADAGGEVGGTEIGEVVAVDGGDDAVAQPEPLDRQRQPGGLGCVERLGPAGGDVAEAAGAGANGPEDHEGGGAAGVAVKGVGATGFPANRLQAKGLDGFEDGLGLRGPRRLHTQPRGLALVGGRGGVSHEPGPPRPSGRRLISRGIFR